jgi:hypothetical protein
MLVKLMSSIIGKQILINSTYYYYFYNNIFKYIYYYKLTYIKLNPSSNFTFGL